MIPQDTFDVSRDTRGQMVDYPSGFTCEVIVLRLERYVVGALPRAEALAVAEHLEACPSCVQRAVWARLTATQVGGRSG
jgi:anti-sigma factor RsiW